MIEYIWRVVKNCRMVGYVVAYSEREALVKAERLYGERIWIERTIAKESEVKKSSPSVLPQEAS